MHFLSCAGLVLLSNRRVPGLIEVGDVESPDVHLFMGSEAPAWASEVAEWRGALLHTGDPLPDGRPGNVISALQGGRFLTFRYWDGVQFLIDQAGSRVWCRWPSEMTLKDAATYLLGPILGYLLRARGVTALHASVIEIADRAVAFVGSAGAGKSTIAAAFAQQSHRVLSDDLAPLRLVPQGVEVQPTYPVIRLWEESVLALYGSSEALPLICPSWEKRYKDLREGGRGFDTSPLPLGGIYLLGQRHRGTHGGTIEREASGPALINLAPHTNARYAMTDEMLADEFSLLAEVVRRIPVKRIHPPKELHRIARMCQLVASDFEATR